MQKGIKKLRDQQLMNKGLVPRATQKKEPWREVVGKTFNLAKMESAHSRKMTKWKVAKKLNLKRWGVEALKEERLEVSSLRTPQEVFREKTSKEENYEK